MKTFTYEEVTENTIKSMKTYSDLALAQRDEDKKRVYEYSVLATYQAWYFLTIGHQQDGDDFKLRTLAGLEATF